MKKLWKIYDVSLVYIVAAIFLAGITVSFSIPLAAIELAVATVYTVGKFLYYKTKREKLLYQIGTVSDELDFDKGQAFQKLGVACCVIEADGSIIWFNDSFCTSFGIDKKSTENNICDFVGNNKLQKLVLGEGYTIKIKGMHFSVHSSEVTAGDEKVYLLYFFDETALRLTEREYLDSIPSIILTVIDNSDEVYQNFKESECTAIFTAAEQMIEHWAADYGALCRKYSGVRMLIFVKEKDLRRMIESRFTILDKIRDMTYDGKSTELTLSMGIGSEGDIIESNAGARQALDMAQSRGGDQVAHKIGTNYNFYGGVSEGKEKKNKVRTRLIAKTVSEIISDSDNVLIMGHRFSDFDSFGSAVGMHCIAGHFGKNAKIVLSRESTLALPLVEKVCSEKGEDIILSPGQAMSAVGDNTLLIVTDTHKRDFTECPELIDRAKKIMVIDHHRKSVSFIDNTVMFYHMPNSSSASEMVAELAQYVDKKTVLDKISALALLTGIMLDTRNFILRAGVRTFEAAAYLRSRGASPVDCKKLFSSDMDIFRSRNAIIDDAERYEDCAISKTESTPSGIRLITSQAADEMLNIEGVKAAFVIFRSGAGVNISARSYGEINVQLIMEALGGGGHQTMSACQLGEVSLGEAEEQLKAAIDNYKNNTNGG